MLEINMINVSHLNIAILQMRAVHVKASKLLGNIYQEFEFYYSAEAVRTGLCKIRIAGKDSDTLYKPCTWKKQSLPSQQNLIAAFLYPESITSCVGDFKIHSTTQQF